MSKELTYQALTTGVFYVVIRGIAAKPWRFDSNVFENWTDGNFANYAVPMTQEGTSGLYYADMPALMPANPGYTIVVYKQLGGSPAISDTVAGEGVVPWSGASTATVTATPDDWTTLAYVKNAIQLTVTTYDNFIQQYITSASRSARTYINNRQLLQTDWQEIRSGVNTRYIRVWNYPIISLTQIIAYYNQTGQITVPGSEFTFEANTGVIQFNPTSTFGTGFYGGFQNYRIDYTGGFSQIPWDIQDAIAVIVKIKLFTNNFDNYNIQTVKAKDSQNTYFNPFSVNFQEPMFGEAKTILDRYKDRRY